MNTVEEPEPKPDPEVVEDDDSTTDHVRSLPAHMIRSYGILDSEFPGPSAFGPGSTAIGTMLNIGAGQAGQRLVNQRLDGALVLERIHTYAKTATPDRLIERLARLPVAYLSGPPGSGRMTATLVALARAHAADKITQLHLLGDEPIRAYFADPNLLRPSHGHIVELTGALKPESSELAQLSTLAREAHASVVFVGADAGNRQLLEYNVEHVRPDPREVFLVWLERNLRDKGRCIDVCPACEGECVQAYVERCRAEYVRHLSVNTMTDAVRFAVNFAELVPDGSVASDLLADRAALRAKAVDLLEAAHPQDGVAYERRRARHLAQHRRAARLAFAVFNNYPLTRVFDATSALNMRLDEAVGRSINERTVLEHNLEDLLDDIRLAAPVDGAVGAARVALLRQPGLVRGLLDVAWHEYDTARQPLLEWLDDLAENADARPVAAATGLLCEYDFEQIRSRLLDKWAVSKQRSRREAAALACEMAVLNHPALTPQILHCVAAWAEQSGYRRDTAVRTYATRTFLRRLPQEALTVLSMAARDDMQRTSNAVPFGVRGIYDSLGAAVVHRLVEWSDSPFANLRTMASRCLVRLADVNSNADREAGTTAWPALLCQTAAGEVAPAEHARLWPGALLHPGTARQAWSAFGRWIGLAATDEALADVVHEVLSHVLTGGPIIRRANFYLQCFWRHSMPDNPTLITVTTMLEERRRGH
ncbi:hypothetical protein ABT369_03305 [Dactylosporangium sp. NPDC000244]|uniref:hypothetical protein n=1 Tax=Dactylosporangium sp. NPDC000244 TaxID=3154365 RepID=UPI0033200D15